MKKILGILLGLTTSVGADPSPLLAGEKPVVQASEIVAVDPLGVELAGILSEAEDVGSGKRGPYPFSATGKEALLADMGRALEMVPVLVERNVLTAAEGELVKIHLNELLQDVHNKRSKDMMEATCYEPIMMTPAQDSFKRLSARIPYLEKLTGRTLSPLVAARVLDNVQRDLKALQDRDSKASYDRVDEAEAVALVARLAAVLPSLGSTAVPDQTTEHLPEILAAFTANRQFSSRGQTTTAERLEANSRKDSALEKLESLVKTGGISRVEADLLKLEFENVREAIFRHPPSDSNVTCYRQMVIPPAKKSLVRLQNRLPHVEKLAAAKNLQPSVVEKLVEAMEQDLAVLAEENERKQLPASEIAVAEKVIKTVRERLATIRSLVSQ